MRAFLTCLGVMLATACAYGDVSVSASVDRARIGFGDSVALTISVKGAQSASRPDVARIEGLDIAGPNVSQSMSWVNGQSSQSVSYVYQVTPKQMGEFTIPAIDVDVGGKTYRTQPIKLVVEKTVAQPGLAESLFAKVLLDSPQVFVGQTMPLNVVIFARSDVPVRGFGGFNFQSEGLNYKYQSNIKSGTQVINGESFNVYLVEGAISPTRTGKFNFGPCVIKAQLATASRSRNLFDEMMGRMEVREVPVVTEPVPVEVFPVPEDGKPADFGGAVGKWNIEVTAKPTDVAVGDPVTLTIKVTGNGNIDTVPPIQLKGLENFKTYDPTTKTTKNDLNTTGERVFEQVLVPKSTEATQLPEVRLPYFDTSTHTYKVATQPAIRLNVKPSATGQTTILSGQLRLHPAEKLGQDIVYLKEDIGAAATTFWRAPVFWVFNFLPVFGLVGGLAWKRKTDRLRGDVAYARRSRAARKARKHLETAGKHEEVQHALQVYLGDRLNIPESGITASVAEEYRLPVAVREIFEACDAARFAGMTADVAALKQKVEQVIDELENSTR